MLDGKSENSIEGQYFIYRHPECIDVAGKSLRFVFEKLPGHPPRRAFAPVIGRCLKVALPRKPKVAQKSAQLGRNEYVVAFDVAM